MASKTFSIYNNGDYATKETDHLVAEIGHHHFACLVKQENKITALEWFKFDKEETDDFDNLLVRLKTGSNLLDKYYNKSTIYINNDSSVLVPANQFDKEKAAGYLDLVLGNGLNTVDLFDETDAGIVNAFRLPFSWLEILKQHLIVVDVKHTFTSIINKLHIQDSEYTTYLKVQFYQSHIIIAAAVNSMLQFIQSFAYQTPEDVLYHLLSVRQQLGLGEDVPLEVSGMVDTQSQVYSPLGQYFKQVIPAHFDTSLLKLNIKDFPAHFFTPTLNLAL